MSLKTQDFCKLLMLFTRFNEFLAQHIQLPTFLVFYLNKTIFMDTCFVELEGLGIWGKNLQGNSLYLQNLL